MKVTRKGKIDLRTFNIALLEVIEARKIKTQK